MNKEFKGFFSKINQYNPEKDKKNYLDDIVSKIQNSLPITNNIVFLCTHNSRRSQLCQVWGSILSKIYNIDLKFNLRTLDNVFTVKVLARPGTPSNKICP